MHEQRVHLMTVLSTLSTSQLLLIGKLNELLIGESSDPDQPGSEISDIRLNEHVIPLRALLTEKMLVRSKDPAKQRLAALA